jgi:hypothetical protein
MLQHIVGAIAPSAFLRCSADERKAVHFLRKADARQLRPMAVVLVVCSSPSERGASFLVHFPTTRGVIRTCLLSCTTTEAEVSALQCVKLEPGITTFRVDAGGASYEVETRKIWVELADSTPTASWSTTTTTHAAAAASDTMADEILPASESWLSEVDLDVGRFARAFYCHRAGDAATVVPPGIVHYSADVWPDAHWMTGSISCGGSRTAFTCYRPAATAAVASPVCTAPHAAHAPARL